MPSNLKAPLRPVETDFTPTLCGVLAKQNQIHEVAKQAVAAGVTEVFFVGVGGSYSSSVHASTLLETRSRVLNVRNLNAAEFMVLTPARLGPKALVIASSHSGGTPETLAAAKFAKQAGAMVVGVARDDDNPLARVADHALSYNSERTVTSAKQILLAQLALSLLEETGETLDFEAIRTAFGALPMALRQAIDASDTRLADIAVSIAAPRPVYVVASGSNFGAAFTLSLCYLMEMQWMNASNIAAGDYLHGPFEMLTDDASLIVFQGEDASRPMTERVIRFAKRYGKHVHVIDSKDLALDGVDPALRGEIAAIAVGVLGSRLADHMEATTGHNLDDRRYMYKVEY